MPNYLFTVEVEPQYLPAQSAPDQHVYSFSYTITITNSGDLPAQLIARHWTIRDLQGRTEEVRGFGVVGQQPLLQPGESFRYTSGCHLRTPNGTMEGRYVCVAEDTTVFDSPIPLFVLEADAQPHAVPAGPRVLH